MRLLQFTTAASSERRVGAVVGDGSTTTTTTSTSGGGGGGGAGGSAGAAASTAATSGTTPTHVLDLTAALKALDTVPELSLAQGMRGLLSFGDGAGLAAAQEAVKVNAAEFRLKYSDITVVAPIFDPEKIVCVGMNYVDHCTEQNVPIPKEPLLFSKFPSTIIGPGVDIVKPKVTSKLDFEVELAIVIGRTAKNVSAADAPKYIAGYTVAHDVSARDWQLERNGGQWLVGKTFDTFSPIGPVIVTADELGDVCALDISTDLNGQLVQTSNTAQMVHKPADIVAYASALFTLKPGDLIFTGTPPGVGCFRTPPMFMKAGDDVAVIIQGIGEVRNKVVDEK